MSDIWERYRKLEQNRMHKQHEFMAIYDRDVYYPQLTALREECALEGHSKGRYHDNGLGWHWYYCNKCGASFNKEQHSKM